MYICVINLDRSQDRLEEFRRSNAHLPEIVRFSAVDGAMLDRQRLIADGKIAAELQYTDGALGCAMSHIYLWEAAATENKVITICEDDAIFHGSFLRFATRLIGMLPEEWDLVMWGWNFDSILFFDLIPGVSPCVVRFDQAKMRRGISVFQHSDLLPTLFRLLQAFGTVCYTVSPTGAKKLLEHGLPLRPINVLFPFVDGNFSNYGIDILMNSAYSRLRAYVCFPPLVITKNEHATSTVLNGRSDCIND